MIVLHLTSCPQSLRGDLTKWLMEIAAGVYVGKVSARVRDLLWTRIVETSKSGRAVMVFSTNNEQGMDFRIHGEVWEPIDFDGLKLMLRPSPSRLAANQAKPIESGRLGFSNAAKYRKAKKFSRVRVRQMEKANKENSTSEEYTHVKQSTDESNPECNGKSEMGQFMVISDNEDVSQDVQSKHSLEENAAFSQAGQSFCSDNSAEMTSGFPKSSYVVIDIETTGFSPKWAEIIEIGAIKVVNGKVVSQMQSLVKISKRVPLEITKLTGITDEMLAMEGRPPRGVLMDLLAFVGDLPLVAHNSRFDLSFINAALGQLQQPKLTNNIIDTLALSKRLLKSPGSYKLGDLSDYLGHKLPISNENENRLHRSLGDCYLTHLLYEKLQNLD